jgi:hypothetical protein
MTHSVTHEDPIRAALEALDRLAQLGPDWDTYGADPPSPMAVALARQLVRQAAAELGWQKGIAPEVGPTPDGIALIWRGSDSSEVTARLGTKRPEFVVVDSDGTVRRAGELVDFDLFVRQVLKPLLR